MPTPDCYRDIGAIGARLDEIEKARIERDHAAQIAQTDREARVDAQLRALSLKMDAINAERQQLVGVIWALRILFGGVGAAALYLLSNGVPPWLKNAVRKVSPRWPLGRRGYSAFSAILPSLTSGVLGSKLT
jgi:hypothetical protein